MADEEETEVVKGPKPPILPGIAGFMLIALFFAVGQFTMTAPMSVALPEPEMDMEEPEPDDGPPERRYVSFPLSLTVNVPKWGTLLIEIGMAVNDDLPETVTEAFLTDSAPLAAPMSDAMMVAVEDPDAKDLEALQKLLPPLLRDALNGVLSTEDLPDPVLEVYVLKLITTG
ncbi:hypothetical protein MHM39_01205 [Phaeobacter sp. CNT1-3]|jgi:hypothetical protein|nr:hypothetical protein [Phaeobacter sp. CNT1-3]